MTALSSDPGLSLFHCAALCCQEQSFQLLSPSFRSEPSLLEVTATGEVSSLLEPLGRVSAARLALVKLGYVVVFRENTVDGRNPAPPKKPWNDNSPVNTNKQWVSLVSAWCRISSIPQYHRTCWTEIPV